MFNQDTARQAPLIPAPLPDAAFVAIPPGELAQPSGSRLPLSPPSCAPQFIDPSPVGGKKPRMTKRFRWVGAVMVEVDSFDKRAKLFGPVPPVEVRSHEELQRLLKEGSAAGHILILGALNRSDPRVMEMLSRTGVVTRTKIEKLKKGALQLAVWREVPRNVYMVDIDLSVEGVAKLRTRGVDLFKDPQDAVRQVVNLFLPPDLAEATLTWNLSAKAGLGPAGLDGAIVKLHVFCFLEEPIYPADFKKLIEHHNGILAAMGYGGGNLDPSLYQAVQPHYIANPEFLDGPDPIPDRWGILAGKHEFVRLAVRQLSASIKSGVPEKRLQQRHLVGKHARLNLEHRPEPWPQGHEECLAQLKDTNDLHHGALVTTRRLVQKLIDAGAITQETPRTVVEQVLAPDIALIEATIRAARPSLPRRTAEEIARMTEYAIGALALVFAQRTARFGPPSYPDTSVRLETATTAINAVLSDFVAQATAFANARRHEDQEFQQWIQQAHIGTASLFAPTRAAAPPRALLATEVGSGKTTIALRCIIQGFDLARVRVYFFVPTHALAEQLAGAVAGILSGLAQQGVDVSAVPAPRVFQGRDQPQMCKAAPAIKAAAACAVGEGLCIRTAVCQVCPNKGLSEESGCLWYWQDDASPGLKIAVTASIGANSIPGFPRSEKARASQTKQGFAPIVAVFLDEGFGDALQLKNSIPFPALVSSADVTSMLASANPQGAEQQSTGGSPYSGARGQLNDIIALTGRSAKYANAQGDLAISPFEEARRTGALDRHCEFLGSLLYRNGDAAADVINRALREKRPADFEGDCFTARRKLRFLLDLLTLARRTPPGRKHMQAAVLQNDVNDRRITLKVQNTIPDWLAYYPLMLLDATAAEGTMIPFSVRDEVGNYSAAQVQITKIRVRPDHSFRVKIINAPETKTKIVEPIRKAPRRRGTKKTLRNKTEKRRLRRDACIESLARFVSAVSGRANSGGLITNKKAVEYLRLQKALPGTVISNWLGNIRGLSTFENVDVLTVIGRVLPALADCESGAAATYAFAPGAREIQKGRRLERVIKYARVRGESGDVGVAVDTLSHPCKELDAFIRHRVCSEDVQARGRARAIRRNSDNPVLEISINNIVDDTAYDALLDWSLFAGLDERAATLHAHGVVPLASAEFLKLAPHLFSSPSQCRQVVKESGLSAPAPLLLAAAQEPTNSRAWTHPLLLPAEPRPAIVLMRYRNRTLKKSRVWLDARRPDAGAAALASALSMKLERWQWLKQLEPPVATAA